MSTYEDSPAFPIVHPDGSGVQYYGMTLRDYFAAKAMASLINSNKPGGWNIGVGGSSNSHIAEISYALADSMIEARK